MDAGDTPSGLAAAIFRTRAMVAALPGGARAMAFGPTFYRSARSPSLKSEGTNV